LATCIAGCGAQARQADFSHFDGTNGRSAGKAVSVSWSLNLAAPMSGPYIPVEQASPAVDSVSARIYAGSTRGMLWALDTSGRKLYGYDAKAPIEAQPTIDPDRGELYVATLRGTVLALRGEDGTLRWKVEAGASISQPGILSRDALYVVTDQDMVLALARSDGSVLWRYKRDPHEGFAIAGHAGLTEVDSKVITGFGDGAVVALDASDGRVVWEADTSVDLEQLDATRRFTDVDTTPAVVGDTVYAASFSGGVYAFDLANGTLRAHEAQLKSVTALTGTADALFVSSADHGVVCLDTPGLTLRWRYTVKRGAAGRTDVRGSTVYFSESLGALVALEIADGREIGRLETSQGITAPAMLDGRRGFVLSNAGTLYAFTF
jgi:outer membrane protein assembly factor BamB